MCYELIISTNYNGDLSSLNQPNVYFKKLDKKDNCQNLKYANQYHIATMCPNGCSCHIRNFCFEFAKDFNFEFMPFQDWYEELNEDFDNARFLFQVIKNLVNQGFGVDSFLCWSGDKNVIPDKLMNIKVNEVIKEHFVFFEYVYFHYEK